MPQEIERLEAREMRLSECGLVIDYFLDAKPDFLDDLGVDPWRLPERAEWQARYQKDYARPLEERQHYLVLWRRNAVPIGFSSVNKIQFGEEAYMHLHITDESKRKSGYGSTLVRQSVDIYFDRLKVRRLFCEPHVFNTAPNRTLQKAGFKYVKTHMTVPGPLNYRQAVNRWVVAR